MKTKIITTALSLSLFLSAFSQEKEKKHPFESRKFTHSIVFGLNIGAATPTPLPANIRKINKYNPEFCPSFGYEMLHHFTPKWSIGFSAKIDYKGMSITDSVAYYHTSIQQENNGQTSSFEGDFTGTNRTFVRNVYFNLPVYAVWVPNKQWYYRLGGYIAYRWDGKFNGSVSDGYIRRGNSLGEKVLIDMATFDFSKDQQRWDAGIDAGAGVYIGKRWSIQGNLQWGLRPLFPSDFTGMNFKMYNIFANIGAALRIL
ncbi:MAG: porin family protein [Fluviicola sp.]